MRKPPLLVALLFLLAACSGAPAGPTPGPSPTRQPGGPSPTAPQPTGTPAATDWRVLATDLSLPEAPFAVAVAYSQDSLDGLWMALGQAGSAPAVDFASETVLFLGASGSSSCPEILTGLVVDEAAGRVYGQWLQQEGRACTDDLAPQGVLLAVPRQLLPQSEYMLSLRETLVCPDCPGFPDHMLVTPPAD